MKRSKRNKVQETEPVKQVRYDQLEELVDEYKVGHDQVKCPMLRQPITREGDQMNGTCALNWKRCSYEIPVNYLECERHKKWQRSRQKTLGSLIQYEIDSK